MGYLQFGWTVVHPPIQYFPVPLQPLWLVGPFLFLCVLANPNPRPSAAATRQSCLRPSSMVAHKRLLSEALEQDSISNLSSVEDLSDFRCCSSISISPLTKRRKTSLNSRFDRMLEQICVDEFSPRTRVGRRRSQSSSSASSYDIPKTPVDAYSGLQEGRLGRSFSVIKMDDSGSTRNLARWRTRSSRLPYMEDRDIQSAISSHEITHPPDPLPQWLSNTFSTLEPTHPLRSLMLSSDTHGYEQPVPNSPVILDKIGHTPTIFFDAPAQDSVFAYCPPEKMLCQQDLTTRFGDYSEHQPIPPIALSSVSCSHDIDLIPLHQTAEVGLPAVSNLDLLHATDVLPFSTPGPTTPSTVAANIRKIPSINDTESLQAYDDIWPPFSKPGPTSTIGKSTSFASTSPPYNLNTSTDSDELHDSYDYSELASPTSDHFTTEHGCAEPVPGVFLTPGPAHGIKHPIYFDSPGEDPFDSDPAENGYQINSNDINFSWQPFIRSDTRDSVPSHAQLVSQMKESNLDGTDLAAMHTIFSDESSPCLTDNLWMPKNSSPISRSPSVETETQETPQQFVFTSRYVPTRVPETDSNHNIKHPSPRPSTPEANPTKNVFAPTPGVFISPLRGMPSSEKQEEKVIESIHSADLPPDSLPTEEIRAANETEIEGPNGSQDSYDSIQSWGD